MQGSNLGYIRDDIGDRMSAIARRNDDIKEN